MRITLLLALTFAASAAIANQWTCEQGGLIREVTIYYPALPAALPCEVYYSKRSEQVLPKRLWSAANEEGYCERKAEEFVETLRGLGWQCRQDEPEPEITEGNSGQGS